MAKRSQAVGIKRRIPRQIRAEETVSAILEAAAQVLEAGGLAGFTTNAVAERAGVSIGTLYQYFADKRAILVAAAQRELAAGGAGDARRQRALIEALIAMLETLGGLGGAAAGGRSARSAQRPARRGGESWERRLLDLAHGWLVLAPPPSLRPIPIPPRGGRR